MEALPALPDIEALPAQKKLFGVAAELGGSEAVNQNVEAAVEHVEHVRHDPHHVQGLGADVMGSAASRAGVDQAVQGQDTPVHT